MPYDLLRRMTPREFESIIAGLREYRAEEHRAAQQAMESSGGKRVMGGGTLQNP